MGAFAAIAVRARGLLGVVYIVVSEALELDEHLGVGFLRWFTVDMVGVMKERDVQDC